MKKDELPLDTLDRLAWLVRRHSRQTKTEYIIPIRPYDLVMFVRKIKMQPWYGIPNMLGIICWNNGHRWKRDGNTKMTNNGRSVGGWFRCDTCGCLASLEVPVEKSFSQKESEFSIRENMKFHLKQGVTNEEVS